jgi:hypothetical protein
MVEISSGVGLMNLLFLFLAVIGTLAISPAESFRDVFKELLLN